jgi:hypothetical protein
MADASADQTIHSGHVANSQVADAPLPHTSSRRSVLAVAGAAIGAAVASSLARVLPTRAANGDPIYVGYTVIGTTETKLTNSGGGASPDAIHGVSQAGGSGLKGEGKFGAFGVSGNSSGFGLWGQNTSSGNGVNGDSASGHGVHGKSTSGYGAFFEGGKAPLRLVPKSTTGRPTGGSHKKGELYLDSAGSLFVCVAGGTPGTWRKVSTTAA